MFSVCNVLILRYPRIAKFFTTVMMVKFANLLEEEGQSQRRRNRGDRKLRSVTYCHWAYALKVRYIVYIHTVHVACNNIQYTK